MTVRRPITPSTPTPAATLTAPSPSSPSSPPEGRRLTGDTGAAMAEFALVLPVLAIFVLGLLEFGNAWRQDMALEATVSNAGRVLAQTGRDRMADYEALQVVATGAASMKGATVDRVVVWKANGTSGDAPPCRTGSSQTGLCNVYDTAKVTDTAGTGFTGGSSTCLPSSWDAAWCPLPTGTQSGRADGTNPKDVPADYVGVYVEISVPAVTGIVSSDTVTLNAWAVYRIEPPYGGA